nr:unnamed protein product [Spirometra erinaceieuropaei]
MSQSSSTCIDGSIFVRVIGKATGLPTSTSDASPTTSKAPATALLTTAADVSTSTSKAPVPSTYTNETQKTNSTEQGCAINNDTQASNNEVTLYTVQAIFAFYADIVLALTGKKNI